MISKNTLSYIKILNKLSKDEFQCLVECIKDQYVDELCECVFNVVYHDLKIPRKKLKNLKRHIKTNCSVRNIKKITDKNVAISKRRRAMKMEGKGLPLILASVIPFLTSLFTRKRHN